jgi:hypothetical protein
MLLFQETVHTTSPIDDTHDNGELTRHSQDLLAVDEPAERPAVIDACEGKMPAHTTTITCMESINKNSDEEGATSCLVVGTENKQVVILDATGFAILVKVNVPSVRRWCGRV